MSQFLRAAGRRRTVHSLISLARWLGPWSGDISPPGPAPDVCEARSGRGRVEWLRYRPARPPIGAYVVVQGLHPDGPRDPRLDRLCRVLAASGLLVCAPLLPDYLALRMASTVTDDLRAAWDAFEPETLALGLPRPALFSISFGSLPALSLAASPGYRDRVGAAVIFGGYADFGDTVRFAITGKIPGRGGLRAAPSDPLNPPAVFLNLLPYLDAGPHGEALEGAWRAMIRATWGRMELKRPGALRPIGDRIAAELPAEARGLFLVGCGLEPGGDLLLERGLERAGEGFAFADPRPAMAGLQAPVVLVHGRDDDVIPWTEAERLGAALPPGVRRRLYVTGLYGHTGAERPRLEEAAQEGKTMLGLLAALVRAPVGML